MKDLLKEMHIHADTCMYIYKYLLLEIVYKQIYKEKSKY